jgi:site-specific recombinase XerD
MAAVNYSPRTRRFYLRDVRRFLEWIAESGAANSIGEIQPVHLHQYQIALYNYEREKKGRLSVSSQRMQLTAVGKFFDWLVRTQQIAYNPTSSLQMPHQSKPLPQVLSKAEASRLIESMPMERPVDLRNRAIAELLYGTGIRRGELLGLSIYDLDLAAGTLTIREGKGDQTRVVPLTERVNEILKRYVSRARSQFTKEAGEGRLFVSCRSGGPLDDDIIGRVVLKAAKLAGIKKRVTPHMLRHSCATHLLAGKADIRQIQKLLGHRRLSSTEVYTHVETSDLREVLRRCHPREKKR